MNEKPSPHNEQASLDDDSGPETTAIAIDHFEEIVDEQEVPPKYLAIFIDETEEALDTLTETLLNIESDSSSDHTQSLLVTSHRIKGSAASVGLNRPAKLAHFMEDILQELRESGDTLTADLTDAMLKCTDALRHYVAGLKSGSPESESFNSMANDLLSASQCNSATQQDISQQEATPGNGVSSSQQEKASEAVAGQEMNQGANNNGPAISSLLDDQGLIEMLEELSDSLQGAIAGRVTFEENLPLAGLKGRLVYEKLSSLGNVFYCDPPVDNIEELESLTTFTFGLSSDQVLESVRSNLQIAGIQRLEVHPLKQQKNAPETELEKPTVQVNTNSAPASMEKTSPAPPTKTATPAKETREKSRAGDSGGKPNETLRVDIERLDQLMNLAGQLVINKARFSQIGEGLKQSMLSKQTPQLVSNAGAMVEKIVQAAQGVDGKQVPVCELEAICSHARRLQTDLETISAEIERLSDIRNGVGELFEAVHQLDRVAEGIQQSVMDTRMVPIGPLFGRFKRVIRDITRNNQKDIRLVIRGEKTELDKRMIDELGDPLIHMVRNSADHGIESPQDREAAGKSRQGVVTLEAFHRGNSILIQVQDDGKGLSSEKIIQKALEKNIVQQADVERMTPHQIYQLIWEPGFSTAEQVTEISGRGMGMDIVRSKIEELNGTVEVDSEAGVGTTFTIKLPLTLAILPSLLAEIEGDVFALPVESVVEIVNVPEDELSTVHNKTTASIRGRIVSVVDLNEVFTWHVPSVGLHEQSGDCTLVVIGHEDKEVGLKVHSLLGEEDVVIKSLAENYQNVHGIAGASILGNGRVSLILDVPALIEMSSLASKANVSS